MKLPDLSINKPVTVTMIFLGIVLMGLISLGRLPQELFPAISYPQLTIVTTYENAAPEEVETLITKIIEEAVGTVGSLKRISSTSKEGISLVTTEFNWGTNMDFASLGVREKIDLVKERLPLGSADPIVMKFNPFELPVMTLSVTGEKTPSELLKLTRKFIKDEIEKVPGVASCNITGGLEREIIVSIDQARLRASGVAINKVVDALKSSNLNYPAGTIEEHFYEYLIRTIGEFEIVSQIKDTVVGSDEPENQKTSSTDSDAQKKREENKRLVYLKDISEVKDTFQERTSISRFNGKENISVGILKQAGSNTLQVADRIKKKLGDIKKDLPGGIEISVVYDQSIFIRKSIRDVGDAAWQGGLLAFFVLWLFLKKLKPALIVSMSIPISIMITFMLMYFSGISLNMLSLGGLALGIGMLVDAGIVVIENISNHIQSGKELKEAARVGANEVENPIWGSVMTTVVVFLPMIFVTGIAGQLFKEVAITVTYSLIASLYVSLALIPLFVTIGKKKKFSLNEEAPMSVGSEFKLVKWMGTIYGKSLPVALKNKKLIILGALVLFLFSMIVFRFLNKEFMPKIDQREFVMKVNLMTGTRLEITDSAIKKIEKKLLSNKDVESVAVTIGSSKEKGAGDMIETLGSHQASIIVNLKKGREKGKLNTSQIIQNLKKELDKENLEGAEVEYILQESIFKSALMGSAPIVIEIKGHDLNFTKKLYEELRAGLSKIPGAYGIRTSLAPPAPETKVNIIKDKAALYNLSVGSISQAAHVAIKGVTATKFKEEGREVDIKVRLRPEDRKKLSSIRGILVHSPLGIDVPLSEVAYISHGLGPSEIKRLDQQRIILMTANVAGRPLDKVIDDVNHTIDSVMAQHADIKKQAARQVEKDFTIQLAGENQEMKESFLSLMFALILSVLLVYMIMASEFESFWQPFIIMFTLPLSLIGVSWTLFLTHTPISVVVILGVITLGGVVVDNGIVLLDKINALRNEGKDLVTAVSQAAANRLRPIMMTSFTTVLGLLPLALGLGEGSELQAPMAITVMGGLTICTFLTLFVIPALYTVAAEWLDRKKLQVVPIAVAAPVAEPVKVDLSRSPIGTSTDRRSGEVIMSPKVLEELQVFEIQPQPKKQDEPNGPQLTKRQIQLLERIKKSGKITRKEYSDLFKISIPTAARDLRCLMDRGFLKAEGPLGPGRWYELK
ncbi:MAG: efflux RND transporter permease subunit [Candidatus Omnitrophota bacterium]|nr:efflux RND transporter permease subunit [Candidatus Omnitrophota bacterium]